MTGKAYEGNAGYPEVIALITEGTPKIWVVADADIRSGRTMRVVVHPGFETSLGPLWACEPFRACSALVRRDGRLSTAENARRSLAARFNGVTVPIEWTSSYEMAQNRERDLTPQPRDQNHQEETDVTELFDTTNMRHSEALRRLTVTADATGQGDLFAEPVAESVADVEPFTWPTPVGALYARDDVAGEMMLA